MARASERKTALADVYAEGFLAAVEERGDTEEAVAAFDTLIEAMNKDRAFAALMMSSSADDKQRWVRLEKLFGQRVNDALLNLLKVMNGRQRLALIPQVHRCVALRMKYRKGQQEVTVHTPTPLSDTLRSLIREKVSAWLGRETVIVEDLQPELIGGMVLQIGDLRIDGSVAARINRLRERIKERVGHAIHGGQGYEETTTWPAQEGINTRFQVDEIATVIKEEIIRHQADVEIAEVGRVLEVGDGIARIYGLGKAMAGEMLEFKNGVMGQVFNLEERSVGAVVLGDYLSIKEGDLVRRTGQLLSVPVGEALIGRVVNPLGRPLDGLGPIDTPHLRLMESSAPGIADRQPVDQPLQTGIKAVDSMVPIGRGQRELIIGDRKTGKTALCVDTIINQQDTGVICVYVAIGQKESTVAGVVETLRAHGAMNYTIVVAAGSADPAPLQYIAPYAGAAIAEYFMYEKGMHTLCVYDDLSKQAAAYRQLSLLLRRPPGREAYPGDVFYLHSRLLERSCKLANRYFITSKMSPDDARPGINQQTYLGIPGKREAQGFVQESGNGELEVREVPGTGGSMTALPVIETLEGEVSSYIPTNLISITDGQIYLEPDLFYAGVRPAINVGISVSRVGGKAQIKAMKQVAGSLRLDLAAFRELQAFTQLGSELGPAAQRQLDRGKVMVELLKQGQGKPYHVADQVIIIFAGIHGLCDDIPLHRLGEFEEKMLAYFRDEFPSERLELIRTEEFSDALAARVKEIIVEFKREFLQAERRRIRPG